MSFRIIQSCERKDEQVATGVYAAPVESTELRDPGALIIDEFLTEEDEASILASLEAEDLENTDDDWSEDELTFGLLLPEIS